MPHSESFSTTDPSKLTDVELDCLKEAFSLFDADHDGEITVTYCIHRWNNFTNKVLKGHIGNVRTVQNFLVRMVDAVKK